MNLGNAIKMCRARRGLTQAELATRAGLSVSYLSLLEKNKRDATVQTVKELSAALSVPLGILFFLAADKSELVGIDQDLAAKLSHTALLFLNDSDTARTLL